MRRFEQLGLRGELAINPRAFFDLFMEPAKREAKIMGSLSIVEIVGPLVHHRGWCDSYDAISERVDEALASSATTIVLKIDSPGGEAAGCMDTAREIRAKCQAAGKRLIAFVDGMACSAAYALACSAERIVIPATSIAGSIGVMHMRLDATKQDQMFGTSFALISSSSNKGDNNPHLPVTEAEIARTQATVNKMAGEFFQLVADARGMSPQAVAALDARLLVGSDAVSAGLADTVQSFDELLAAIASGQEGASMADDKEDKEYEKAISTLRNRASGDGDLAKKAKRMLAAELEDDAGGEGEGASAEGGGAEIDEEKKKKEEEAKASAATVAAKTSAATVATSTAGDLGAVVQRLSAQVEQLTSANESQARSAFLAERPDLSKDLLKVLETKPLAECKAIVNAIPKAKVPNLAATALVPATQGAPAGVGAPNQAPRTATGVKSMLDARMGVSGVDYSGVIQTETQVTVGAPVAVAQKGK